METSILTPPPVAGLPVTVTAQPPYQRFGQAYRLADTCPLDRQSWLPIRQTGIGSSDGAAAVGLNPYKVRLELWMDKIGRSKADDIDQTPEGNSPLCWVRFWNRSWPNTTPSGPATRYAV